MKTRTFLAIEIKPEIKKEINTIIKEFKKTNTNIKYVKTENLHLTLKFFGNITDKQIKEINEKIKEKLNEFKEFKIKIKGLGAFPNTEHIKVIWIGVEENKTLEKLQKTLDSSFKELGFKKEENYKSHLTIGRMKNGKNKNQIQKLIKENENKTIGELEIKNINLKKSTLTPKGPIYEDIETFKLNK